MAPMHLTPEQAARLLNDQPSPMRDTIRREWLRSQETEELLYWIGSCANEVATRAGVSEAKMLANLAELANAEDVAAQRAAGQAATS